jgi:dolichol kinase
MIEIKADRGDLHLARRFFHFFMGATIATVYWQFIEQQNAVAIIGLSTCIVYVVEQLRINYPEFATKVSFLTAYLLRAEEQLKESSTLPFVMAILLCIISFPKMITVAAIYTLSLADPMSAIIGIRFGKKKINDKTLEGSAAFFTATFICIFFIFYKIVDTQTALILASATALITSAFELVKIRLDDNLTIPIFTAVILRILCWILNVPLG